jgi:ABC-type multidrug transport system fused ATPase/permease subunit
VVFVSSGLGAPAAQVLLVLAAGARLSAYIGATVGEIGFLRGFWMDGSRRLAWLEDYAASVAAAGELPVPGVLQRGIQLDHVSFAYPGTSRLVLEDVSLTLPAGAVVAVVGENGAGKTTLVKLLAKMYEPSSGAILLDQTPLARGFMRDQPLLLILDEPTAALDAETEHSLFERYAAAARGTGGNGRITILVSHRFSTVRMADLIVVLDGARLVEMGTHDELMARGGPYSELYGIQAAAYK